MAFAATFVKRKPTLSWLDLRASGLSALERLCLEEVLLRHSPKQQQWAIMGTHEPTSNRILRGISLPNYIDKSQNVNKSCVIVMGIGGKPENLLNMDLVRDDGVLVLKRFSGGGTVVLDHASLWTTFIGRNSQLPQVEPFPRPIMKWSADAIFGPAFEALSQQATMNSNNTLSSSRAKNRNTLVMDTKGGSSENSGRTLQVKRAENNDSLNMIATTIPSFFALVETDYCLGSRKMGGNAQSIVKDGWLHHTSFLWDYEDANMEYLSLPSKQPNYRANRSHDEFLVKLKTQYDGTCLKPSDFFFQVKKACEQEFEIETVTLHEALAIVNDKVGGLQNWFETKCRTKIITI